MDIILSEENPKICLGIYLQQQDDDDALRSRSSCNEG